jgi:hypothetical protein
MEFTGFLGRVAAAHGCTDEAARELVTAVLAALNEVSYKQGSSAAAVALCHAELGSLAAWHLMGLVVDAADRGNPGALVQEYTRIDGEGARHDAVARGWDAEVAAQDKR